MSTIYERAVASVLQTQVDQGIDEPRTQLKTIERRMRVLQEEDEKPSISALVAILTQGLMIKINYQEYVAELSALLTKPERGLIKRLSRTVDKKTKNPKTSQGTIWRRNSVVQERRRQSPNWSNGTTAQREAAAKSIVSLVPLDIWLGQKSQAGKTSNDNKKSVIQEKRTQRGYKKALEAEFIKRMEKEQNFEEWCTSELMEKLSLMTERQGVAQQNELSQRVLTCIKNNQPIPIIFVWGPPYEGQGQQDIFSSKNSPESRMANEIEATISNLGSVGVQLQPILLYADVYGTEINQISSQEVNTYFSRLKERFSTFAIPLSWSEVRENNFEQYSTYKTNFIESISDVSDESVRNSMMIQEKLGRSLTLPRARELALKYKIERLTEGKILNEGFIIDSLEYKNLIKMGTAPSREKNDEPYEPNLPRFYIKNMTRASWNKPRN